MSSLALILLTIGVFFFLGAGPTLLLFPARSRLPRLLLMPVMGIAAGVLVTICAAGFGLTGRVIAPLALAFFAALNAAVLWRRRPGRREYKEAWPLWLMGLAALGVVCWPLLVAGYRDYWGYANPDQSFYLEIFRHIQSNPFGIPYSIDSRGPAAAVRNHEILGIAYFPSIISWLTGVPISRLFGVLTAAVTFLAPGATYVLALRVFMASRRVALLAAAMAVAGGHVALTFYLHSLGAMTVIVMLPVTLAVAAQALREGRRRSLVAFAVLSAGMYYGYYPGFAVLGVLAASVSLWLLAGRRCRWQSVAAAAALSLAGMAVYPRQAFFLGNRLLFESFSSRLEATGDNEVLLSFAVMLTERIFSSFWGFQFQAPANPLTAGFGQSGLTFLIVTGIACTAALLFHPRAGRRSLFLPVVGAGVALVLVFLLRGNGYGVFKLLAWMSVIHLAAFCLCAAGLAERLWRSRARALAVVPVALLAVFTTLNAANTIRMGRYAWAPKDSGSMHNLPRTQFRCFQELAAMPLPPAGRKTLLALPDRVMQAWAVPFVDYQRVRFLPRLSLDVQDSVPREPTGALAPAHLLGFSAPGTDFIPSLPDEPAPLWKNRLFALMPVEQCRNCLVAGMGWYRPERFPAGHPRQGIAFRWLRKRAELFVLNPSPAPVRLCLTLDAGFGGSSTTRRLQLWVDGAPAEDFELRGHARWISRPLRLQGAAPQIEVAVRETAPLRPRPKGWWNKWIPTDPRRLNLSVSGVSIRDAGDSLPESAARFEPGSMEHCLLTAHNGIFLEGWMGAEASVRLHRPPDARAVTVRGMLPGGAGLSVPYRLQARWNGVPMGSFEVKAHGDFTARFALPRAASGEEGELVLVAPGTFQPARLGLSDDTREFSVLLREIATGP